MGLKQPKRRFGSAHGVLKRICQSKKAGETLKEGQGLFLLEIGLDHSCRCYLLFHVPKQEHVYEIKNIYFSENNKLHKIVP